MQDKYLEKDETNKLLETMSTSRCSQWYDLTEFLILSGLRIGEAIALTKKGIQEDYIYISKSYDIENNIVTSVKTLDSNREVFIQDELKVILKRIQLHSRNRKIASPLLFYDDAGNYLHYDAYRKFLKENSLKAIGREIKQHVLHHTHASLLMANGVSIEAISRRLGHADSKITRDIYLHIMEQLKERDNDQLRNLNIL